MKNHSKVCAFAVQLCGKQKSMELYVMLVIPIAVNFDSFFLAMYKWLLRTMFHLMQLLNLIAC